MPYDTWALNEGRINEDIFLEQANSVLAERKKILKEEFLKFKGGIFFFYFEYPDIIQHMFWHRKGKAASPHKEEVLKCYREMDDILGWIMKRVDKDTILMVLSDHGFGSFDRTVHLNSWLRDNGFLKLQDSKRESGEFFENVDWQHTKAYALGFGGIYINQLGREKFGIVAPGREADVVLQDITTKLSNWHDPQSDNVIVKKVYTKREIFTGKYNYNAPDLFVGFNEGYRASWQTALGAIPSALVEDVLKPWRADHIFDPSLVPGVFFVNRKEMFQQQPKIIDVIPTVFQLLGIDCKDFDGKPFLRAVGE
jgi:predicted AlkP superfamily phosphohydrolase/phosphomutase